MHEKYKQDIESYADGEMDSEKANRYKETLQNFPALSDYLQRLEAQKKLLKKWWGQQTHH